MYVLFIFQLHKDPSNADAQTGLATIEPLKTSIEQAYASHEAGDFHSAIEFLKEPIEVTLCEWNRDYFITKDYFYWIASFAFDLAKQG